MRGRNSRGRGGRGGDRGGDRGGYRGGRNRRPRRNNHHHHRDPRAAVTSGNERERIAIESGHLVLIDQFMLANPQFIERLVGVIDEDPAVKDDLIRQYGGTVVEVKPDTYKIDRDPFKYTIIIRPADHNVDIEELTSSASDEEGHVFVDTRCLAMIDRELLDDNQLLEKYQQLWFSGQEKACRDLLRDNGGAVRYGFRKYGDELGVYLVPDEDVVCLWPDIAEGELNAAADEA